MTKTEQRKFVTDLAKNVTKRSLEAIAAGKIPEEWDGHELRVLLARHFNESASMTLIAREPRRRRAQDFRNTCIINNL